MQQQEDMKDNGLLLEYLARLEERIARLEDHLGLERLPAGVTSDGQPDSGNGEREQDELELEVGQDWFAKVGIVVLALGMVFLLTFPYAYLPPAVPGLAGYVLAGALFLLAHVLRNSFDLVARYLRGAGAVLPFFTTLRLFHFGSHPVLIASSLPGMSLLTGI